MADSTGAQTFCGECGTRVRPGAAFCASCGEPLSTPRQSGVDNAESSSNSSNPSPVASQAIESRLRQRWDSVGDGQAASTSGADEERSDASSRGPVAASGGSGGGSGFDLADPVGSFLESIRGVVLQPSSFFSRLPRRGDFINPLVFALSCAGIYYVLAGILGVLGAAAGFRDVGEAFGTLFLGILLVPIAGTIGLFVWAGILHLLTVLIIKPQFTGFETTFRVGAYSTTPLLLAWIPILGPIVSGVWSTVLAVLGIREGHSTSTGKAAAVVLIPVAVVLLISLVLGIVMWIFINAMMNEMGL